MLKQNNLKEIEIKLFANSQILKNVQQDLLLTDCSKQNWRKKELFNQYIDTPDKLLTTAKVALRIRQDGEHYIQTLKAKGHSIGGFSERDEFDWIINGPQLDLFCLDEKHWPKSLAEVDKTQLKTIFSTDFIRDYILVDWQVDNVTAQIEVALDQGLVKVGQKQEAISELELELRQGNADVLLDFAIHLASKYPLFPSDTSKAERGYRLIVGESYQFILPSKPEVNNPLQQTRYYLASSQRLLENYLWRPDDRLLFTWFEQLEQLQQLLKQLAGKDLVEQLAIIIEDWRGIVALAKSVQVIDKVKEALNNTRWGVFSLSTSRWLLNQ